MHSSAAQRFRTGYERLRSRPGRSTRSDIAEVLGRALQSLAGSIEAYRDLALEQPLQDRDAGLVREPAARPGQVTSAVSPAVP